MIPDGTFQTFETPQAVGLVSGWGSAVFPVARYEIAQTM